MSESKSTFPDLETKLHDQTVIREQSQAKKEDDQKKERKDLEARAGKEKETTNAAQRDQDQAQARRREEEKSHELHKLPVGDVLAFSIIDLQRGIDQLKQNSAGGTPGTYVYAAIQYFEAAVLRLDGSLELERGGGAEGKKLSPEDRAKLNTRYEQEYRDHVYPEVVR